MDPTLQSFILTIRRWWWLAVLIPAVAAAAAYSLTRETTEKTYVARATVMVGDVTEPASDLEEARLRQSLVATYTAVAGKDVVLAPVVEKLSLSVTTEELADSISVEAQEDAQLIEVSARDRQPARAVEIANAVADQLVALSAGLASPERQAAEARVLQLQLQITDAETQVEALSSQYALAVPLPPVGSPSPDALRQGDIILDRINLLQSNVRMWRDDIRDLETAVGGTGTPPVTVLEGANKAKAGKAQSPAQNAVLGGAAGLLAALFAAFLLGHGDDRIRTNEDVRRLGQPPLPSVRPLSRSRGRRRPDGAPAEPWFQALDPGLTSVDYGRLYAQLDRLSGRGSSRIWTIAGAGPGDDATTTALALALAAVRMEKRVILVDANWSSPDLSRRLQLSTDRGLSALPSNSVDLSDFLVSTPIPGLSAVAAGPAPLYSQRLLNSEGLRRAVRRLAEGADLVIVDAPAVLEEMNMSGLAAGSDGTVLVVRAASTRQAAVSEACDILAAAGAPVLGVVLTNASSQEGFSSNDQEREPQAEPVAAARGDGHVSNVSSVEERK